jgi:CheY-like chemotaxis protein
VLARDFRGCRILLAEDEPVNQLVATDMLEVTGLQIDLAEDGREAADKRPAAPTTMILMDMQMPQLDGLDATRRIRMLPGCAALPIVAMTANAFNEDRQNCLEAGMNDFLTKPVVPVELYATILKWLRQTRS